MAYKHLAGCNKIGTNLFYITNMRVHFADTLLDIGTRKFWKNEGKLNLNHELCVFSDQSQELIDNIYHEMYFQTSHFHG